MKAKPDLSVSVGNLKLKNPLILGSGEMGRVARGIVNYADLGCSAIVTKSVTPQPWGGNPTPHNVYINATTVLGSQGDPNVGFEALVLEIKKAKDEIKDNACVVVSIDPDELEDTVDMAVAFENAGADALEIKVIGCPNYNPDPTKPVTSKIALHYWMQSPDRIEEITKALTSVVKIPIWLKFAPRDAEDIKAMERGGASGLHIVGDGRMPARGLVIDFDTGKPMLGDQSFSGTIPFNHYAGLKRITELASVSQMPIMYSGGIWEGKDVIECIMCGASAVQVYTSIWLKGPRQVMHILDGIEQCMIEKGIRSLDEIKGITLKYLAVLTK